MSEEVKIIAGSTNEEEVTNVIVGSLFEGRMVCYMFYQNDFCEVELETEGNFIYDTGSNLSCDSEDAFVLHIEKNGKVCRLVCDYDKCTIYDIDTDEVIEECEFLVSEIDTQEECYDDYIMQAMDLLGLM